MPETPGLDSRITPSEPGHDDRPRGQARPPKSRPAKRPSSKTDDDAAHPRPPRQKGVGSKLDILA